MTSNFHYPYQLIEAMDALEQEVQELKKELEFLVGKDHERDTKEAESGGK